MTNAKQWERRLKAYEKVMNVLLNEDLQPHQREALFTCHQLMRERASGGEQ